MFILEPFNGVFFLAFLPFLLLLIVGWLLTRNKSEQFRANTIAIAYFIAFIYFWIYKYQLSIDAEYSAISEAVGNGAFSWWSELPLQLCNINLLIIPIAVLTRKRPLLSFAFFLAPLGALMALAMPSAGFSGYSVFLPRMLGFFGTHFMVFLGGPAIVLFGFYRPKFRDLPLTVLTHCAITIGVFGINMLLRVTGLNPFANYFFSVHPDGNPILEIFHNIIPVPLLFLLPALIILVVYMVLVTLPFHLYERSKQKKAAAQGK